MRQQQGRPATGPHTGRIRPAANRWLQQERQKSAREMFPRAHSIYKINDFFLWPGRGGRSGFLAFDYSRRLRRLRQHYLAYDNAVAHRCIVNRG
jgi:hypothetical protein